MFANSDVSVETAQMFKFASSFACKLYHREPVICWLIYFST